MFRRAISNLISNAIKYSDNNSIIYISISSGEKNDSIVEVKNKCKDISYDNSLRMFDRFYRADLSRSSNNDSVGLGLSIVKSIMKVNGGKAWNKVSGNYISFYLLFPAK